MTVSLLINRLLWRLCFLGLLGMVAYLTVKPHPQISEERWMPEKAAYFFDLHDDWKNVTGFASLAFAAFLGWPQGWGLQRWSLGIRRFSQVLACCGITISMESLQLLIPTRHCDWKDMMWGSVGILLALFPALLIRRLVS